MDRKRSKPKEEVMRWFLTALLVLILSASAYADVRVRGYTRKDGTYVAPHYRSSPNNTVYDNWSYKGNTNPYTGEQGSSTYNNTYRHTPETTLGGSREWKR